MPHPHASQAGMVTIQQMQMAAQINGSAAASGGVVTQ